ncbi:restriction endonuclease subunit S [Sulfuricella sp.]|uniref:restriction endonuclease subunit S n=1 Tax=Sulfuricella sp. TaxID=2099377 RepID=UPI002CA97E94|nr:restriction endonuclease subunit S [Sulfuricella sp.]HUX63284.1 restriction endonuclease subunit S [Sulfuricella sp.]
MVPLNEVATISFGTRVTKKRDAGTLYPVYGGGGATFALDEFNRENCFIVSRFGMSEECVRFVCGKFFLNDSGLTADTLDKGRLHQRFLDTYLVGMQPQIYGLGRGTAQKNLNVSAFKEMLVPLPPLEEQKRIVAVLDQAFAALDRARALVEQSRCNASEVFDNVLASVDGEQRLLGSLVTVRTGKLDANAAVENGQYPFFTCAKDVYAIDRFAFDCEAILLAGNNAVGDFNVKHYRGKFNAYQRTYVITINDTNQLIYRYLYFQLVRSLKHFKEESVGAGTKFLKLGMINGLKVSVPTAAQQQHVVTMLDTLLEKTQRLEALYIRKLAEIDELKKSLLKKTFPAS